MYSAQPGTGQRPQLARPYVGPVRWTTRAQFSAQEASWGEVTRNMGQRDFDSHALRSQPDGEPDSGDSGTGTDDSTKE